MEPHVFIETERLILRELMPSDDEGMFMMDADPEVHKYLGNKPIKSIQEAQAAITFIRQQYDTYGIGRWAVIEKATGDFVGWSGLKFITEQKNDQVNYYDIGYRLMQKHWGKGYATETAIAARDYAFDVMKLDMIVGTAHIENLNSQKILQKIGLKYIETFEWDDGIPVKWYKMDRSGFEYKKKQP